MKGSQAKTNDVAIQLFEVMGIKKEDKEKRMDWMLRGFRQFDAPVSLVLTYDKYLEPAAISHFALGALSYGIVLAAWDRGIGCVKWPRHNAIRRCERAKFQKMKIL